MMQKLFLCLVLALSLAGCAGTPETLPSLNGASLAALRTEKVAVSYSLVSKKINYRETLYRGLWLEYKSASQDFSGVWSADRDLTSFTIPGLRREGINATSAYELVDAAIVQAANEEFGARVRKDAVTPHPEIKGTRMLPNPNYFANPVDSMEMLALIAHLKAQGCRYLLQLTAMDVYGTAIGLGGVVVMAQPNVRVIDLDSGKVVWSANYAHSELYQLGGELRKLEADDMALTRAGLQAGIAKLTIGSQMDLGAPAAP